jgi:hypothetical protein
MSETLTDVEWINVNLLSVLHAAVQRDVGVACARYGLTIEQAQWLRGLSLPELWALALRAGNTLLFTPRPDLMAFTRVPDALAGTFAVLHCVPNRAPPGPRLTS